MILGAERGVCLHPEYILHSRKDIYLKGTIKQRSPDPRRETLHHDTTLSL